MLPKGAPNDSYTVEKMVEYLLSSEGEFLRDALVDDLVDTADSAQLAFQLRLSESTGGKEARERSQCQRRTDRGACPQPLSDTSARD